MKKAEKQGITGREKTTGPTFCGERLFFEQIGMSAGTVKKNFADGRFYLIDQQPVVFNMTLHIAVPITVQQVGAAVCRKGLLINDLAQYPLQRIHILAALFHQPVILFESAAIDWCQHGLFVPGVQIGQHFL
jgi:hypothetical protein